MWYVARGSCVEAVLYALVVTFVWLKCPTYLLFIVATVRESLVLIRSDVVSDSSHVIV